MQCITFRYNNSCIDQRNQHVGSFFSPLHSKRYAYIMIIISYTINPNDTEWLLGNEEDDGCFVGPSDIGLAANTPLRSTEKWRKEQQIELIIFPCFERFFSHSAFQNSCFRFSCISATGDASWSLTILLYKTETKYTPQFRYQCKQLDDILWFLYHNVL